MKNIAIINPSSPQPNNQIQKDIKTFFSKIGYNIILGENTFHINRFLAGTDEERLKDLHWAFSDKQIDGIVCLRGGYGSGRLLDKIDYDLIQKNPKPFITFSDGTALNLALWSQIRLPTYSGFLGIFAKEKTDDIQFQSRIKDIIENPFSDKTFILGGTMTLIESLIGTKYLPDFTSSTLLLEEVGEKPYRVDRMLNHLNQVGIFNNIKEIIWGDFYRCLSTDDMDGDIHAVINEWQNRIQVQHILDKAYSHQNCQKIFQIGFK